MSKYAEDFIKEKYIAIEKNKGDSFTSVVVRLEPQSAIMLKVLSHTLNFPVSTSFSEIINKNLIDMVKSLDPEKIERLNDLCKGINEYELREDSALSQLKKSGILKKKEAIFDEKGFMEFIKNSK